MNSKVRRIFYEKYVRNLSTVEKIIKKFGSTDSVADAEHTIRTVSSRSVISNATNCESVAESPEHSIGHGEHETDIQTVSLHCARTNDLHIHDYQMQLT